MKRYRLKASELEGLTFQQTEYVVISRSHLTTSVHEVYVSRTVVAGRIVPMYLYNERDVERKAWEHHGSPEAFDAYLDTLRNRYIAKHGNALLFPQPRSYEPAEGAVYVVRFAPGPSSATDYDPHVGRSPKLLRIKQQMPSWLWEACNRVLDRDDDFSIGDGIGPGLYTRDRDREGPMATALRLAKTYPPRPAGRLPSSPAIDSLRAILDEAPRMPKDHGWGEDVEGMEMTHHAWPDEDYTYEWNSSYLDRLFTALIEVIRMHGVGDDGWRSARWEVYDKYSECVNGLSYERREDRWFDSAGHWLDGQYSVGGRDISFSISSRSKSSVGKQYNEMLPFRTPRDVPSVGLL
ncbi:hypothetical protein C8Q73DRAFT_650476 [Cubamyces lactineus]|nr:hypothetical protein C8Q73DRAFT_650476 [Cubamyces lactineus]